MSLEPNAEHVEAFTLEPIGTLPDFPYAWYGQRRILGERCFYSKKAAIRKRSKVPHDFDWRIEIAILYRGHVAEKIVSLLRIVMQPSHHVGDARGRDEYRCLAPDDFRSKNRAGKFLRKRDGAWIRLATAMPHFSRRHWCARLVRAIAGLYDRKLFGHGADRVWWTELPNGSPSSSITDGGM